MSNPSPVSSINHTNTTIRSSIFSTHPHISSSVAHIAGSLGGSPTTSISRVGSFRTGASTSVYHPGAAPADTLDAQSEEARDRIRYRYAQRKMQEKRAMEELESELAEVSIGTGGAFRGKKVLKGLMHMKYAHPEKYKNLSASDLKYFKQLIGSYAGSLRTGRSGFSNNTKLRIKRQLWKDSRAGIVQSRADRKDMEQLINDLPSAGY